MNISRKISQWRVVAASICGTSHTKNKQLCQDAHAWRILPDSIFVAAVADGAGSASLGKIGAIVATETAVDYIAGQDISRANLEQDDIATRLLLSDTLVAAKKALLDEAEASSRSLQDFATTLIVCIATPNIVAVAQVGDGVAVAKDKFGDLIALTAPDRGEYINETIFLTTLGAAESPQVGIQHQVVANIAILTDGLQMLALNMANATPHKPFFFPLFDFVANTSDIPVANEQLVRFLRSERITQRTDDDLTLILASLSP